MVECKANLLQSIRELVSDHYPFRAYEQVFQQYFDTISKNNSIKVQFICLLSIRKFLEVFPKDISDHSQHL